MEEKNLTNSAKMQIVSSTETRKAMLLINFKIKSLFFGAITLFIFNKT